MLAFEVGVLYVYDSESGLVHQFAYAAGGVGLGFGGAATVEIGELSPTSIEALTGGGLASSAFAAAGLKGIAGQIFGSGLFNDSGTIGGSGGAAFGAGAGFSGLGTYTTYLGSSSVSDISSSLRSSLGL